MFGNKYFCCSCKKELVGKIISYSNEFIDGDKFFCDMDCFQDWRMTTTEGLHNGKLTPAPISLKFAIMIMDSKNEK